MWTQSVKFLLLSAFPQTAFLLHCAPASSGAALHALPSSISAGSTPPRENCSPHQPTIPTSGANAHGAQLLSAGLIHRENMCRIVWRGRNPLARHRTEILTVEPEWPRLKPAAFKSLTGTINSVSGFEVVGAIGTKSACGPSGLAVASSALCITPGRL
jgi:hypothetical protein